MPYFVYGGILSVISLGFYIYDMSNSTVYDKPLKQFLKFMVSLSSGWILLISLIGGINTVMGDGAEWFLMIIFFLFLPILFLGFNMMLYNLFHKEK